MRVAILGLVLITACVEAPTTGTSVAASTVRERYLVVFRSATLPRDAAAAVTRADGSTARAFDEVGVLVAVGDDAFAAALARNPAVLAVGPERWFDTTPTAYASEDAAATTDVDPYLAFQWDMARIGAPASWARSTPAATVAVLDTGVADDHPDLAGKVVLSRATSYCDHGESAYPRYDHVIDLDTGAWCDPTPATFDTHGTHVAGTIAAKSDGRGIVGVAPDAQIAAYKVFDRLRRTDASGKVVQSVGAFQGPIFEAIIDATLRGHRVINLSLVGTLDRSDRDDNAAYLAWERIVSWAHLRGTVIVAAAGNSAFDTNGTRAIVPSDLPTVISVSATATNQLAWDGTAYVAAPDSDVLASYSNHGASIDLAAPGGDCGPRPGACDSLYLILSSCISGSGRVGYCRAAGTSMAAPHVAAAAALVRGMHPDWTAAHVRTQLESTATNLGDRLAFGRGLLDVDAATN